MGWICPSFEMNELTRGFETVHIYFFQISFRDTIRFHRCYLPRCFCIKKAKMKEVWHEFCKISPSRKTEISCFEMGIFIFMILLTIFSICSRCSERGTRNCHRIVFRKVLPSDIHIENIDQKINFYGSVETEIRLPFCRPFSTF